MERVCTICGASHWRLLPSPRDDLVLTTSLRLIHGPLGKAMCGRCGAVHRISGGYLADTDYYEHDYTYYNRPGAEVLDQIRYRALADWVKEAVAPYRPSSVFDIGCGRGGTMNFLREAWPDATFAGIEPFADAVTVGRSLGFDIAQGRLAADTPIGRTFDLVFSNNVLQHTADPVGFLQAQTRLLSPHGHLVLSCPDGTGRAAPTLSGRTLAQRATGRVAPGRPRPWRISDAAGSASGGSGL
jgi:SAM-dependent methyltransferase